MGHLVIQVDVNRIPHPSHAGVEIEHRREGSQLNQVPIRDLMTQARGKEMEMVSKQSYGELDIEFYASKMR